MTSKVTARSKPATRARASGGFSIWRDDDLADAADVARRILRVFGRRAAIEHALRTEDATIKFATLVTVTAREDRRTLLADLDAWSRVYWRWRPVWSDLLDERLRLLC